MNKLTKKFNESIIVETNEISKDIIEIGIDSVLNEGLFKDIPIVSSILSVAKIGYNLRERNLCIQLLNFINELNDGCINRKKLENYQKNLNKMLHMLKKN